jgi:hypothetical protein
MGDLFLRKFRRLNPISFVILVLARLYKPAKDEKHKVRLCIGDQAFVMKL